MGMDKTKEELQEELKKAREEIETLGGIAGSIANDINNLLTAILGNVSLTKIITSPDSKAFLRLAEAERACQRAKHLTEQLLTFSKGREPVKEVTSTAEVESETAVHLNLTVAEKPLTSNEEAGQAMVSGRGKILIMDDEEMVRRIAGEMLKNLRYEVEFAREGNEAIERYTAARQQNRPFDVVIIDLKIAGGMGGVETMKNLLEIDPHVKAILSSGYSNAPVMAQFGTYGFKGAIIKPYSLEELSEIVSKVMSIES